MEQGQILIKLLSIGDPQVGKSCIIKRYCEGRFVNKYITTIGVDYGVKKIQVRGKPIAINFFDLSGDDCYEEIRNPFYKDTQVVLLVFDLDNNESFLNLQKWEKVMRDQGLEFKDAVVMLVGNKSDLNAKGVTGIQAAKYAKKRGFEYIQTSANTGDCVAQLFEKAFNKSIQKIQEAKRLIKA